MESIAASIHAAKLQPQAMYLKKRMGIAVGVEHADLVVAGR